MADPLKVEELVGNGLLLMAGEDAHDVMLAACDLLAATLASMFPEDLGRADAHVERLVPHLKTRIRTYQPEAQALRATGHPVAVGGRA